MRHPCFDPEPLVAEVLPAAAVLLLEESTVFVASDLAFLAVCLPDQALVLLDYP